MGPRSLRRRLPALVLAGSLALREGHPFLRRSVASRAISSAVIRSSSVGVDQHPIVPGIPGPEAEERLPQPVQQRAALRADGSGTVRVGIDRQALMDGTTPTGVGEAPTRVGVTPTGVGLDPTRVGVTPTAVGLDPT